MSGAGADFPAFVRRVAADPGLCARLRPIADPRALARAAVAEGAASGYRFTEAAVEAAMHAHRHGFLGPPDAAEALPGDEAFPGLPAVPSAGWTPFRLGPAAGATLVEWCHLGARRFTEPFFFESIARAAGHPFNRAFRPRCRADALGGLPPGPAPSGFLFHMARCGSTLCAQVLAADPAHIVASEPMPVRAVLEACAAGPFAPERADAWLAGLAAALARPRFPGEYRFFLKFMAGDVLSLPRIQRVFPEVPWLFLYRDPTEILASQLRMGGADTMRGAIPADALGLAPEAVFAMPRAEYQLRVMAALGRAALAGLACAPGRGRVLRYDDLPGALWRDVPAHFGFEPGAPALAAMRAAVGRNAKSGGSFAPDGAGKRAQVRDWREAAERIAGPVIAALDAARRGEGRSP